MPAISATWRWVSPRRRRSSLTLVGMSPRGVLVLMDVPVSSRGPPKGRNLRWTSVAPTAVKGCTVRTFVATPQTGELHLIAVQRCDTLGNMQLHVLASATY